MPLALELWSRSHLAVLSLSLLIPLGLILVARASGSERVTLGIGWGIAFVLGITKLSVLGWAHRQGLLTWANGLPMHLCDWAAIAAIIALATRWQPAYEAAFFWGLAGTFQAMLTPDLAFEFPQFEFISFYLSHGGVIAGALFLTFAYRLRPRPGALLRIMLYTNLYVIAALLVNTVLNANYGYLCAKPMNPSLLDHLGPWPWYILTLEVLALALFSALYLPFLVRDRARRNR